MNKQKDNQKQRTVKPKTTPKRGRPEVLNENDTCRVIRCFEGGLSITETAGYLKVSRNAVTNFLNGNPELKSEIQALRDRPKALAKMIILQELEGGSVDVAKWLIEREAKREGERERSALIRIQRKILEKPAEENPPTALNTSEYWARVDAYFSCNNATDKDTDTMNPV